MTKKAKAEDKICFDVLKSNIRRMIFSLFQQAFRKAAISRAIYGADECGQISKRAF